MRISRPACVLLCLTVVMLFAAGCGPAAAETAAPAATLAPSSTPQPDPSAIAAEPPTATSSPVPMQLALTSPAFSEGGMIPSKYSRRGGDISLPLEWDDPPQGTVSLALIFYSQPLPDGGGNWVQSILYNIPGDVRSIAEGLTPDAGGALPDGSLYYINSWGELKYGGPNPIHYDTESYFFELYALDAELDLVEVQEAMDAAGELPWIGASKAVFMRAIEGHVLALGELWGKYKETDQ